MSTMSSDAGEFLAQEMNAKYPVMVYAMTKKAGDIPPGSKITSCKVTKVTNTDCELSYVTCRGNACSMPQKAVYKFNPPLGDKVFMLKIQSSICAPKFHWLFTKPLALLILVLCTVLFGPLGVLGIDEVTRLIGTMPQVDAVVTTIFGNAHTFSMAVLAAWCFTVVAHAAEAVIAYRFCELMPFANHHASAWGMLVFLVGWPIFREIKELMDVKAEFSKKK